MKLKNIVRLSTVALTSLTIALPITLTTSCAEKKNYTFDNIGQIANYLETHKQDVSQSHCFVLNKPNQNDYKFVEHNFNLQLLINCSLALVLLQIDEKLDVQVELQKKNNTKFELITKGLEANDFHAEFEYSNSILHISIPGEPDADIEAYSFDFKLPFDSTNHYATVELPGYSPRHKSSLFSNEPIFTQSTINSPAISLIHSNHTMNLQLSPYDWTNKYLTNEQH
ncbi:MAG: hypothetical protein LBD63_04165 [Mycoplasmataceae bacterium]|jgi:hypothetical protein|nr:hypothetical protein [Mycoplasmataceae bacterium]